MSSPDIVLSCTNIHKQFGGVVAVDVDRFELERQSITALIGPNGAGKTTLFDIITGFVVADRATIVYDQTEISTMPAHEISRSGLVRTFQLTRILTKMTVLDNMLLAASNQSGERLGNALVRRSAFNRQEQANTTRALELLDRFALLQHADEFAGRLSGGQKKLLELARALMTGPSVVLLDEPMAGVNPSLGETLLDYVRQLREEGLTFLFVEHDMDIVMRTSDRVVVMAGGAVIASGSPQEVRRNPRVVAAYLGEHPEQDLERGRGGSR